MVFFSLYHEAGGINKPDRHIMYKLFDERKIGMPYEEKIMPHHVMLDGRSSLSVSGVEEVESFDENTIVMATVRGTLVVRGMGLHVEKLSLDGGDLKVEGTVDSLIYEDDGREKGGFLARLLR